MVDLPRSLKFVICTPDFMISAEEVQPIFPVSVRC